MLINLLLNFETKLIDPYVNYFNQVQCLLKQWTKNTFIFKYISLEFYNYSSLYYIENWSKWL